VEEAQESDSTEGFADLVASLVRLTGLDEEIVEDELLEIRDALDQVGDATVCL
jgi:hypothetical protein